MRRSKLAVVAALAAVSVTALPGGGTANAALGPCRVQPTDVSIMGWHYVAIAGAYTAPVGAIGVDLTCGAVVNGITYATVSDELPGPVAAVAGPGAVRGGDVRSCYVLRVHYLDGSSTFGDTCP